jgi:Spy/CpxP family protein refolding chaperone
MVAAQTNVMNAPHTSSPVSSPAITAPGFPFPPGFTPPAGLFDPFWNDSAITAELHLTDAQRRQLQDAALTQRLALIDGGADALKAFTRLSAILDADQLDDAAYQQQLDNLARATGKIVKDLAEMTVSPRRVLSVEQWRKLQTLQRAKRATVHSAVSPCPSATHSPTAGNKPCSTPPQP